MKRSLGSIVKNIVVVAHTENIDNLLAALAPFDVPIRVQRKNYDEIQLGYPAIARCLLNHQDAWTFAESQPGYTLICEADFVPVENLHRASADWLPTAKGAWAHLYVSSPRLIEPYDGFYRIHQATAVAYILDADVAGRLRGFVDNYERHHGFTSLAPWDAFLQWYAMGEGARLYMPPKSLGEHGGIANLEHGLNGMRHGGTHRADSLHGKLAFKPAYSAARPIGAYRERLYFRIAGIFKVLFNRWIVELDETKWSRSQKFAATIQGFRRFM